MQDTLQIQLDRSDACYLPGDAITGSVSWDLTSGVQSVSVRLFWRTQGKGTQDLGVAQEITWEQVAIREQRAFTFAGVDGPYSFSGQLISVCWVIEAYTSPGNAQGEQPIVLSPTGAEIRV